MFLFQPSPRFNEILIGVLARARRLHPVGLSALVCLSNHFHLLLEVPDAQRLADFMQYVNCNLAREVARLTGWRTKIFEARYRAIPVSDEEPAQIERLRYILSHGCKENLVDRLMDWPGVHMVHAILRGEPFTGYWFDRSQEYAARCRREEVETYSYATPERLTLDQLPCWRHLTPEQYRARIVSMIEEIQAEGVAARKRNGSQPLGRKGILLQSPLHQLDKVKKSPAPRIHAASKAVRRWFYEIYSEFVRDFRDAAEKLRSGNLKAPFPRGCFPPALPFVGG
jgi:REP element-mobilizing transposase RayT